MCARKWEGRGVAAATMDGRRNCPGSAKAPIWGCGRWRRCGRLDGVFFGRDGVVTLEGDMWVGRSRTTGRFKTQHCGRGSDRQSGCCCGSAW
jgi:hypothetical protein